jgi:mannitol/fructose-specific phosphotransferase system IIA component (Ntr-type)
LYVPEDAPRRIGDRTRITGPRKVGISRFSSHSLMVPRLQGETSEQAIAELAVKMEAEGFVEGADRLVEEALRREAIVSTAVENGLAFPHVRWIEGGGLALALGASLKGVSFDGPGTKAQLIFFLVIPTAASAFYLKLLAGLAAVFSRAPARKALLSQKTADGLWKALCRVTRSTIK